MAASALLKIDVDRSIAGEKTPLVGARRPRGVAEDTNGPLKAPRVDTKLAPQALDLLDDEPRMIKEALPADGTDSLVGPSPRHYECRHVLSP